MRCVLLALTFLASAAAGEAAEWHVQLVDVPARMIAAETVDGQPRINASGLWYRIALSKGQVSLAFIGAAPTPKRPDDALPDSHIAVGKADIVRAWFAEPTNRYDHGVLGDKIEAGALVIEGRDGKRQTVRLKDDAVFEDLAPRLADLNRDGHDEIVAVKSYLKRGSSLAVIGLHKGKYEIVAETPPLGQPHLWLNPVGIADFNGDGKTDIALVRQPHAVGVLELWTWNEGELRKVSELAGVANHIAGSRAIGMSAVADFDGDGVPDIALPSLDRGQLRIVSFAPRPREIAAVPLPAKATTNLGTIGEGTRPPAVALGLADGSLAVIRRDQ